jgi:hypothetical protein
MRPNRSDEPACRVGGRRGRLGAWGWLALTGAGLGTLPAPTHAPTALAKACCVSLLDPTGARALSLGDAVTARPAADALFANPSLLGPLVDDQFLVHNASTSIADLNTFTLLLATSVGSFALSYRLNDFGEIATTGETPGGPETGSSAFTEHSLIATYGTRIGAGFSAGVSYKLFQLRLDCRGFCGTEPFAATTHMLDLGAHWAAPPIPGLELGASLVNVGFPLQVINEAQASPPPARLRVGAAYEVLQHSQLDSIARLRVSVDAVQNVASPGLPTLNAGAELSLDETLFVRAGYGGGAGAAGGAGLGVGLRYDRFDLAVAKSFSSSPLETGDPFQVSFGIRF